MFYKKLTIKETYMLIRTLEMEAGEDFFDCNLGSGIVKPINFLFWAYGKKLFDTDALNWFVVRKEDVNGILKDWDKYSPYVSIESPNDDFLVDYTLASFVCNIPVCMYRIHEMFISHDCKFEIKQKYIERFENELKDIDKYIKKYNL